MDNTLIPRLEILDAYWRFAAHRQEAFFNRIRGAPPPWTDDEIINSYKFCNVYRASDRTSQYLIKNVIYSGDQSEEEVIFRTLLFRIFNRIETWQYLKSKLGEITEKEFNFEIYRKLLEEAQANARPIYTSAYMSCASKAYGYGRKYENHLALVAQMIKKDRIAGKITDAKGLKDIFLMLLSYPLLGKFMAYQLATDLNYSDAVNFSENSFTAAGPGAKRGIAKCFIAKGGLSDEQIIFWAVENQDREFARLGIEFQSLWGRPLHAIDCQGLFCELDKYSRVAFPELKSTRKKIKAVFKPSPQKIDYFYPPKWGINGRI